MTKILKNENFGKNIHNYYFRDLIHLFAQFYEKTKNL